MKHKATADMWTDPFGLTTEELMGLDDDPVIEFGTIEPEQLDLIDEGMNAAYRDNRAA